jgi:hypothetical protein
VGAKGGGEVVDLRGHVSNILCDVRRIHKFAMTAV